jgi:chromosome segregation ATPase
MTTTTPNAAELEAGRCYIRQLERCHESAAAYMDSLRAELRTGRKWEAMYTALAADTAKREATLTALRQEIADLGELYADRDRDLKFEYERANAAEQQVEELRDRLAESQANFESCNRARRLAEDEIEQANQYLDECYTGGDGTEPLAQRIGLALKGRRVVPEVTPIVATMIYAETPWR